LKKLEGKETENAEAEPLFIRETISGIGTWTE
jgi:hypothetical protein